jgi:hypothetical protein
MLFWEVYLLSRMYYKCDQANVVVVPTSSLQPLLYMKLKLNCLAFSKICLLYKVLVKKGKVIPLQAYGAQRVLGRLSLPDSVTLALEGGRLSAICTSRLYPQDYPGTHFKRLSRPQARGIVGCHGKNPQ